MTGRSQRGPKTSLAFAIGSLLVPLSAVAAVLIPNVGANTGPGPGPSQPAASFVESSTSTTHARSSDLQSACGPAGLALVEREIAGTIDAFQQAALDALRPICSDAGIPLPPAEETAPAQVVVTAAQGTGPTVASQTGETDLEWEDDDAWDEDHDSEDREGDDHDEDDDDHDDVHDEREDD